MKTAIVYCGQARTVAQIWENHRWYIGRHFDDVEVFASVADDAQADDMLFIKRSYPEAPFHMEKVVQPNNLTAPPELTPFRSGYPRSVRMESVLKQMWAWQRAWAFLKEIADPQRFSLIVRVRPDTAFLRLEVPWAHFNRDARAPDRLAAALDYDLRRRGIVEGLPNACWVPWWARWGGVPDRFAILGWRAAEAYFTTFQKSEALWAKGAPIHPEQLLRASLEVDGIVPDDTLTTEFLTVRLPSPNHPNGGYEKCDPSTVDIADRARHPL